MWGRAGSSVANRVGHLAEADSNDPYQDLRPVEKLRKTRQVEHVGSVHQVVAQPPDDVDDEAPTTANAKYWPRPRVTLEVARRFVAMVILLGMFAGGTGGMTVTSGPAFSWIQTLVG